MTSFTNIHLGIISKKFKSLLLLPFLKRNVIDVRTQYDFVKNSHLMYSVEFFILRFSWEPATSAASHSPLIMDL